MDILDLMERITGADHVRWERRCNMLFVRHGNEVTAIRININDAHDWGYAMDRFVVDGEEPDMEQAAKRWLRDNHLFCS